MSFILPGSALAFHRRQAISVKQCPFRFEIEADSG